MKLAIIIPSRFMDQTFDSVAAVRSLIERFGRPVKDTDEFEGEFSWSYEDTMADNDFTRRAVYIYLTDNAEFETALVEMVSDHEHVRIEFTDLGNPNPAFLVVGGLLDKVQAGPPVFKATPTVVGLYPTRTKAREAWKAASWSNVDNAHARYLIIPLNGFDFLRD
jgi:hypothetical protein